MNVIFFDGYCGLCNGFVDFILKIDKKGFFKFSPLQSEFAKTHVDPTDIEDLKSVVLLLDGKTYRKAEAVGHVFSALGGIWKFGALVNLLPKTIADAGYNLVSENRYQLFGKKDTCRLPTAEERSRFIL